MYVNAIEFSAITKMYVVTTGNMRGLLGPGRRGVYWGRDEQLAIGNFKKGK